MKFLQYEKETDTKALVTTIHYKPFDKVDGLRKTKEELEEVGVLVDYIPPAIDEIGKRASLYINLETKELWYEYVEIPSGDTDDLKALKEKMEQQKNAMTEAYDAIAVQSEEIIELRAEIEQLKGGKENGTNI